MLPVTTAAVFSTVVLLMGLLSGPSGLMPEVEVNLLLYLSLSCCHLSVPAVPADKSSIDIGMICCTSIVPNQSWKWSGCWISRLASEVQRLL